MSVITADIDLTLEKWFVDDDPFLIPDNHREHRAPIKSNKEILSEGTKPAWLAFGLTKDDPSFDKGYNEIVCNNQCKDYVSRNTIGCYRDLFDTLPAYVREYDPWMEYHFSAGLACDCCGVDLNAINRDAWYRTLCDDCGVAENERRRNEENDIV